MSNTIELLEAIGSDASLRHATPEALLQTMASLDCSAMLLEAIERGDGDALKPELGHRDGQLVSTVNQIVPDEDDEDDDRDDKDDDDEEAAPRERR